ncbi:MAG: RNA methyltransferase [Rhodocyclaceae bacterium]|nr:MAG: RNA methyltransferase [Rhodocyclaceae bacterium]
MKHITSRDNPTFKELKSLAEDSREQRRQGRTLLDGIHLVAAYCDKVGLPEQLILSEHGAAQPEIHSLRSLFADAEILLLRDGLFGDLSDLATPTGVCAVIRIPAVPSTDVSGSCVLLDALQDPGNVGSVLRTAAAAGIVDVFLGPGCAGVWSPRVLRAAQGAHFELRLREQSDLFAIAAGFSGTALAATAHGGESLYDHDLTGDLAWLFGSEGSGLSPRLEAAATARVHVPMAEGSESLNVAAAAAICLFEEVRQKRQRVPPEPRWS